MSANVEAIARRLGPGWRQAGPSASGGGYDYVWVHEDGRRITELELALLDEPPRYHVPRYNVFAERGASAAERKCAYCGTRSRDARCVSCGAPRT